MGQPQSAHARSASAVIPQKSRPTALESKLVIERFLCAVSGYDKRDESGKRVIKAKKDPEKIAVYSMLWLVTHGKWKELDACGLRQIANMTGLSIDTVRDRLTDLEAMGPGTLEVIRDQRTDPVTGKVERCRTMYRIPVTDSIRAEAEEIRERARKAKAPPTPPPPPQEGARKPPGRAEQGVYDGVVNLSYPVYDRAVHSISVKDNLGSNTVCGDLSREVGVNQSTVCEKQSEPKTTTDTLVIDPQTQNGQTLKSTTQPRTDPVQMGHKPPPNGCRTQGDPQIPPDPKRTGRSPAKCGPRVREPEPPPKELADIRSRLSHPVFTRTLQLTDDVVRNAYLIGQKYNLNGYVITAFLDDVIKVHEDSPDLAPPQHWRYAYTCLVKAARVERQKRDAMAAEQASAAAQHKSHPRHDELDPFVRGLVQNLVIEKGMKW